MGQGTPNFFPPTPLYSGGGRNLKDRHLYTWINLIKCVRLDTTRVKWEKKSTIQVVLHIFTQITHYCQLLSSNTIIIIRINKRNFPTFQAATGFSSYQHSATLKTQTQLFVCVSKCFVWTPTSHTRELGVKRQPFNAKKLKSSVPCLLNILYVFHVWFVHTYFLTTHYSISDVEALLNTPTGQSFKKCPIKIPVFDKNKTRHDVQCDGLSVTSKVKLSAGWLSYHTAAVWKVVN